MNYLFHSNRHFLNFLSPSRMVFENLGRKFDKFRGQTAEVPVEPAGGNPGDPFEKANLDAKHEAQRVLDSTPETDEKEDKESFLDRLSEDKYQKSYKELNQTQKSYVNALARKDLSEMFSQTEVEKRTAQFKNAFTSLSSAERIKLIAKISSQRGHPAWQSMTIAKLVYKKSEEEIRNSDSKRGWWVRIAKVVLDKEAPIVWEHTGKDKAPKQDPFLTEDSVGTSAFVRSLLGYHEKLGGDSNDELFKKVKKDVKYAGIFSEIKGDKEQEPSKQKPREEGEDWELF